MTLSTSRDLKTRRALLIGALRVLPVGLGVLAASCQTVSSPGAQSIAPTAPAGAANAPSTPPPAGQAAAAPAPTPAIPSGAVVLATRGDPLSMNPLLNIDNASRDVWQNLFEPLVKPDPATGGPLPALATSWDQSPDGLTYTFHMRPNVTWSDGQKVTADDAKFTFDTAMDVKTNSPWRSRLTLIDRVEAVDPQTFRVVLQSPFCPFLIGSMGLPLLPKHALASTADFSTDEFNSSRPVGSGPYVFKEWSRDDHLTLTANPTYWGGVPRIGQWIRKVLPDANIAAIKLKAGEVDYGAVAPAALDDMRSDPGLSVLSYPGPNVNYVVYNLDRPMFQDKRVRQALTYALDRQAIADSILLGEGVVQNSILLPQSWAFNKGLPAYAYNPDTARNLLAGAGWLPGPDGVLMKDGAPFHFALVTDAATVQRTSFQVIAQDQWRKVGIDTELVQITFAAATAKLQAHDFDAVVLGSNLDIDPDQSAVWSSKAYPGGQNYGHYVNPMVDGLLEQARTLQGCDQAARKPIYDTIQAQIAEDQPYTFLWNQKTSVVFNKRLQNLAPNLWTGASGVAYDGIQNWTLAR